MVLLQLNSQLIAFVVMLIIRVESVNFARKIFWGKCFASEASYMILNRKSIYDCQTACAERPNCVAVDYQRKMNVCRLHDVTENLIHCAGHDIIFRTDFTMDSADVCSGACPIKDCNTIPDIVNAETFGNMLQIGDVVKVKCSQDGSVSYKECKSNGLWTQHSTCPTPVTSCSSPSSIPSSTTTYTSLTIGSVAQYTCLPGFTELPSGAPMSITCNAGGQWESTGFTCQQIDCGPPGNLANAQRTHTATTVGSVATYVCESNFAVSPTGSSMDIACLGTGQWETIGFTCQIDCGSPPNITNAQITVSSTNPGSTVTYTCNSGYSVSPVSSPLSFTCLTTGQWESITLTCQQVGCGTPPNITNAHMTVSSTTPGSIVTYSCNSGYSASPVTSPLSYVCLNTGLWESITFTCQLVDCGSPTGVTNAHMSVSSTTAGSTVTFTCNSGYGASPVGSPLSFTCLNTGQWESITLTCQQINCGSPTGVTNAQMQVSSTTVGSTVTFTCNSGYSASPVGSPLSFTCLNTGQWESITLTCQQIDCGSPTGVTNAQMQVSSTTVGSTVTFTCNSGYSASPVGSPLSFTCLNTGQWESITLTCQPNDCGTPSDLLNGQLSVSATTVGSVATYSCNGGFLVSPIGAATSVTCQTSGVWETISFVCQATVQVGDSCSQDSDCVDPAAMCLYTGLSTIGSRCYCQPLYNFNATLTVCTKVCDSYTSLERHDGQYIRKHNVGDGNGNPLSEAGCLTFCANNYGNSYLSVDYRHEKQYGTNCYCGSVTRQQALDSSPDLVYDDTGYTMFTRTCN